MSTWSDVSSDDSEEEEEEEDYPKDLEILRYGTSAERKKVLATINVPLVKTLLNIIVNVLENKIYQDQIINRALLSRYTDTYETLLDKTVPLKVKITALQKNGQKYLPTFLEIAGDNVDKFSPKEIKRTLKDCPLCKKKRFVKLSNHLYNVHHLTDRKELLKKAKHSEDNHDDDE